MSISCQAADGNNDYTIIDLIWGYQSKHVFAIIGIFPVL